MTKTKKVLVALVVATLAWALRTGAAGSPALRDSEQAANEGEREQLLAKGKAIFVEKCAKCHNERGDRALSSGKPLSERGLGTEAIVKAVNGRLSKGTDEERRAVTLYIANLMKTGVK
jgi:mono/diheme cytochrome c family protein